MKRRYNVIILLFDAVLLAALAHVSMAATTENIWGAWKFDNTSNNVADEGGWTWSVTGATVDSVDCMDNECYDYSGSGQYLSTTNNTRPASSTTNVWIKSDADGNTQFFLNIKWYADNREFGLLKSNPQNNILLYYSTTGDDTLSITCDGVTPDLGTGWNMVTMIAAPSNISLYHNGTLCATSSNTMYHGAGYWTVGAQDTGVIGNEFDGNIDELTIWTRALTQAEITDLYEGTKRFYPFIAPPVDTCTAPGSGDWEVTCTDNCSADSFSANTDIPADVLITGAGHLTLSSLWTFTGSNQIVAIGSGCMLEIQSGGGFR